jgi:TPR repeat protein
MVGMLSPTTEDIEMKKRLLLTLIVIATTTAGVAIAADNSLSLPEAAKLHRNGETVAAINIWTRMAKAGNLNAAYNLATIHQHGDGVSKDAGEALKWYRIAAEGGDRESQSRLGAMYLNGEGTPKDEKEGWRWINMHRVAHLHHEHHPQMAAWREHAAQLIWARDMRESIASRQQDSQQVLAELKRRAGLSSVAEKPTQLASGETAKPN